MEKSSNVLKPMGTVVAVLIAGILLAGILMVPYRFTREPEGYDMSRVHLNTKNATRFDGSDLAGVAGLVGQAVYPATSPELRPDVVLLYDPDDWQTGLAAATLLKPLNGLLMPAVDGVAESVNRLSPAGSQAAGGAGIMLLNEAEAPQGVAAGETFDLQALLELRQSLEDPPEHVLLVDPEDPGTALLAAPWAAFSGDLVVFDPGDIPSGLPVYTLGDVEYAAAAGSVRGGSPEEVAVRFATFEDPEQPLFGWGMNAGSLTGYRAYSLARVDDPAMALLSANLNVRGKPGPLLWTEERELPQIVNNYVWSQRAAWWETPLEGPFHHFFVLRGKEAITFPAQGQADYAVEIGPYLGKGIGMSGVDMLAAAWVALGLASAAWILFHESKFLAHQNWVMRLAWPLLAMFCGPFGILFYYLAYSRPVIRRGEMMMWDRPLWLQGLVATASAVGFGASLMIVSGYIATTFGLPLYPNRWDLFFLGTPMILVMVINYVVAVIVSWLVFQTPMLAMFYGLSYRETLSRSLPLVLVSMTAAAIAMNPGMWWLMMSRIPMMPSEESILWFGIMFFTGFLAFLMAWPINYVLVRQQRKSGLM